MAFKKSLSTFSLFAFLTLPLFSETVILVNGNALSGRITDQNINHILLHSYSIYYKIPKNKIKRIVYSHFVAPKEELQPKEKLSHINKSKKYIKTRKKVRTRSRKKEQVKTSEATYAQKVKEENERMENLQKLLKLKKQSQEMSGEDKKKKKEEIEEDEYYYEEQEMLLSDNTAPNTSDVIKMYIRRKK
ncbi:MAG: hypothetical protein H7A25_21450 [Leptospiraceae bacterium]|nr:hypothetical protein [Leptospiraceae bacterium]